MSADAGSPGRVLGLDLGDVRIGVAVSDPDRRVAVPVGTVHVGQPPGELKAIAALVREHEATLVVVGDPRSLSGERGPRSHQAAAFAEALGSFLPIPVELHDERLSSVEAGRALREAGVRGRVARERVDASAAAVILQGWLDGSART
jgi:putative Holliday junction resolvase